MIGPDGGDTGDHILHPVDLEPYAAGNTGIAYAHRFDSGRAGHDVLVVALIHGNELSGAHAARRLLDLQIRPVAGSITVVFANMAAYLTYDPAQPTRARFVEEDMNRVWDLASLEGPRDSVELRRARQIRPLVDRATRLLDLHSMQADAPPLMLSGMPERGRRLARDMRFPALVVADSGHAAGRRLRDYGPFGAMEDGTRPDQPTALLAECGQHLKPRSATVATEVLARFLMTTGAITADDAARICPLPERPVPTLVEVTERITIGAGSRFRFVRPFDGLEVIPKSGTIIAYDGDRPVRTPYDNCMLVMPSRRLVTGHTAVRLARHVD